MFPTLNTIGEKNTVEGVFIMIKKGNKLVFEKPEVDYLRKNYYSQTIEEIALHLGVSRNTILRKSREIGLSKRTAEDVIKAKYGEEVDIKDLLYDMHHNKKMTMVQIAEEIGCARKPLYFLTKKYGVETRSHSESKILAWKGYSEEKRKAVYAKAHEKTREIAQNGEHHFQTRWIEMPEKAKEQARKNALKMCKNRKRNGMTGKTGSNHPNWNGKMSKEKRIKFRKSTEHYAWIKEVYEKDNYICKVCGFNKGGNLNAHHLYSYTDYEEYRNDVNNGITLCRPCHIAFHKQYGYGKNTKEQFEEFLKNQH